MPPGSSSAIRNAGNIMARPMQSLRQSQMPQGAPAFGSDQIIGSMPEGVTSSSRQAAGGRALGVTLAVAQDIRSVAHRPHLPWKLC